ncbi:MAG: UDP-N-acetylmuramate dehydrogenase, partial [Bacteroidales bacterium]|nr:UDP-N-acetylmuramate dehydrogenase [Bacteroidales bacterium]
MKISYDYSLRNFNTFGIAVKAKEYIRLESIKEAKVFFSGGGSGRGKCLILGGGSNILFTGDFDGTIIQPAFNSIEIIKAGPSAVHLSAEAGLKWDSLVEWAVRNEFGGLENLSYIPGNVGAAPIQNIGAYGVEVAEHIKAVHTLSLDSGKVHHFTRKECEFGYRDSIFKKELKNKHLIYKVEFTLHRQNQTYKLSYGNLEESAMEDGRITLEGIRNAVIRTRKEKLPDPDITGNAGSFFKNPLVEKSKYEELVMHHPGMPSWQTGPGKYKIPAAWLIEKAGWKGKKSGRAGVHEKHALILINLGDAEGREILELSNMIAESVYSGFGISLEKEV